MQAITKKSTVTEDILIEQLSTVFTKISHEFTRGFTVSEEIPVSMRQVFYKYMENFDHTMANTLSQSVVKSFEMSEKTIQATKIIAEELTGQVNRLSNITVQSEVQFRQYQQFVTMRDYPNYIFLGESDGDACDRCTQSHGEVYTLNDLSSHDILPPLHPNCRCRLVAIDNAMHVRYNQNKEYFLRRLEEIAQDIVGNNGGIFYLDHAAAQYGISIHTLLELSVDTPPSILHSQGRSLSEIEELLQGTAALYDTIQASLNREMEAFQQWAVTFGNDARDFGSSAFARWQALGLRAHEVMEENFFLGLIYFADVLALGIPSGFVESVNALIDAFMEDPSLSNALNLLTLGMIDALEGALNPDEPWSFAHFMDTLTIGIAVYGVTRGLKGTVGVDDVIDDIAGLTAEQIQAKFALPAKPEFICDVEIPANTLVDISIANGIMGQPGGGTQYYLLDDALDDWFTNGRPIS